MFIFKRIFYFLIVNFSILFVLNLMFSLLVYTGFIDSNLISSKINLLIYAFIFGFTGSFISLFISKWLVKKSYNIELIDENYNHNNFTKWYYNTTLKIAKKAGINNIEIGIYEGTPNAFATGWSKNNSLIALSSELINNCNEEELEAVIGHEISHISNGDMVTLTLIQGTLNTFVIFLSRIIGEIIDKIIFKNEKGNGISYFISSIILEIIFGFLAALIIAYFSRIREYKADKGAGELVSYNSMINALKRLNSLSGKTKSLKGNMAAFGISGSFSTHPSIENRINNLLKLKNEK